MSAVTNKLKSLIAHNFVTYFKAHSYHLNITGPDFNEYHAFLEEIYTKLWEWHDGLSEQLRQAGEKFPFDLKQIAQDVELNVKQASETKAMFTDLLHCLDYLIASAAEIYRAALPAMETVIGDYSVDLTKLHWKIKATLENK